MPEPGEEKCVICQEAITNPICHDCLQREVEQWLADVKPSLIPKVRDYGWIFRSYGHESTECVICGRKMKVCAHCFCSDIFDLIKNELGEMADEFLFSFNFELAKEAG